MIWQVVFAFVGVILTMILVSSYMAEKRERRKQEHDPMHKDDSDMF